MAFIPDEPVKGRFVPDEQSPVTAMDRLKALQGGLYRGAAGLAGMLVDTTENVANLVKVGSDLKFLTGGYLGGNKPRDLVQLPGASRDWANIMGTAGINTGNPRPDDATSRMLNTGGVIAGGSMLPGASPGGTLAAATGGAVAGETLGPQWTGIGAMAPGAVAQGASALKNAVASRAAPIVETFKQAGAVPSAGQATDNSFLHGLENLAAKFPGGSGVMKSFIEAQQRAFGNKSRTGISTEDAGRTIERGIRGEGGFVERFKATQDNLYNRLDQFIPNDKTINVSKTKETLASLNSDIQGAPNLSRFFKNEKIQAIEGALSKDTSGLPAAEKNMGTFQLAMAKTLPMSASDRKLIFDGFDQGQLPYEAVKKLRTLVGREITDFNLTNSVPKSKWKALYGALSEDLGVAAKETGPNAEKAWNLATNYTRAGMKRIDDVLDRVVGSGSQPEDIFKRFYPTDPDQANKVRATLRSLSPSERSVVSDAVVNRMGRATPGRQNDIGELFSSETFLTNWNKLSPGAKAQLFPEPPLRENIEHIAKAASLIRGGKGIYANPSGTAGSFAAYSVYASPIAAIATGSVAPLVAAGGAAGSAYIGAKMLTSPKVVEWLAKPVNPSRPGEAQAHLARLGVIYNNTKDEELKGELSKFIEDANADQ